jgi:hypothetical protein
MASGAPQATEPLTKAASGSQGALAGSPATRRPIARRAAAAVTAGALLALVVCDLWVAGVRRWSDNHCLTTDVVSSLLVLGVTVLILDEVVARRQRKDRSVSVAVQGLIVYGQALRAFNAAVSGPWAEAAGDGAGAGPAGPATARSHRPDLDGLGEVRDEIRELGSMILVASPSLFDDPEARLFLEEVQRLAATMYAVLALLATNAPETAARRSNAVASLKACRSRLDTRVTPLAQRLPVRDRALLDGVPNPIGQPAIATRSPSEKDEKDASI